MWKLLRHFLPWRLWFLLSKPYRKKLYFQNSLAKVDAQIWQNEFTKHQLSDIRTGMREQYDWLSERVQGAQRKLLDQKYAFFYETGDLVKVMDMPFKPDELETLPNKKTEPHRYYKTPKPNPDHVVMDELNRVIERRKPDLAQAEEQLKNIDLQSRQIDTQLESLHQLKASLHSILRRL